MAKVETQYCTECDGKNDEICTEFISINNNNICDKCHHTKDFHKPIYTNDKPPSNRSSSNSSSSNISSSNISSSIISSSNSLFLKVIIPPDPTINTILINTQFKDIYDKILQNMIDQNIIISITNDGIITVNKDIIPNIHLFKRIYTTIGREISDTLPKNGGRLPYKSRTKKRTQRRHKKHTQRRHKKN